MAITVTLPRKLEAKLRAAAEEAGVPVSTLVQDAVAEKLARKPSKQKSAYELGKHLFGSIDSGRSDTSKRHGEIVGQMIDDENDRRHRATVRTL